MPATAAATWRWSTLARPTVWLGVIVAAFAGVQTLLATAIPSPWIVPDELIYSEMAKSIAAGQLPAIRGVTTFSYGVVYPLLISPAWLVGDTTTAYAIAHAINALLMSLAAIPSYLLARHFVSRRSALIVAALAVLVPSSVYTSSLLVENALYPAFLFALLTMVRVYERPTIGRQLVALCAIGVACEVKALAIVLVPAHLVSIWLTRRREIGRFRPTFVLLAGAVLLGGSVATVSSGSPTHVVGAYAVVLSHVDPLTVPWWFMLHLAELAVAVALIPFVATALVVVRSWGRDAEPNDRLFAALLLPVLVATILAVAAFASWPTAGPAGLPATTARLYERSTFQLLPLLLIGFALWLESTPRLATPRAWAVALGAAVLVVLLPMSKLRFNADFQAPSLVPWLSLGLVGWRWALLAALGGLAVFTAVRRPPRHGHRLAWIFIGVWFAVGTTFAYGWTLNDSRAALGVGAGADRDWVDAAVGRDADVAVLWREPGPGIQAPAARHRRVWINEFFNRSLDGVYVLGGEMPYGLPVTQVKIEHGVVVSPGGSVVTAPYALASCDLGVSAPVVARDARTNMAVYRTAGPIRLHGSSPSGCS